MQKVRIILTISTHLLQIQTILSVLELHQISTFALADFTADREFHPALKTYHYSVVYVNISNGNALVNCDIFFYKVSFHLFCFTLTNWTLSWAFSAFFLLQLRHCPSWGHGGLFSLLIPRFSLTPALTLFSSGHGGLFLLLIPRYSLTLALASQFSGHDNLFYSPMPLILSSPHQKIQSNSLAINFFVNVLGVFSTILYHFFCIFFIIFCVSEQTGIIQVSHGIIYFPASISVLLVLDISL